ncbi:MAG TPA: protein kinase [Thermoanaerobaculia bacterium]|nr:protein kinase [Thermoanaerobaculia bacterium]
MTLATGTRFGPYEVVAHVAEGGMGDVYRARDTRLDRTVAIKILPAHLAADPETRRRFEREARAISALSHPNICTLYDIGNHDGREYLVMEYLDGETLADRLAHGPLSLDQVIAFGVDICDALEKAHRQGIIHRDLKPGNVVITRAGAKLLDFGLAKWMPAEDSVLTTPVDEETQRQPLTTAGMVLGTIPYMAPEQLEAKEVDARTDIFAFGAILYEMVTGQRAFDATSNASLIAAIMREEPRPVSELRDITPRALEQVIKTCLSKDPGERFQSAHDIKLALKMIASTPMPDAIEESRRRAWLLPVGLAAIVIIAMVIAAAIWLRPRTTVRTYRFTIAPPTGAAFPSLGEGGGFALSPDGARVAFVATTREGRSFLWLRALDSDDPELLDGTEGAEYPFWSPDNRELAFFADGKLKRMHVPDGPPQTICDAPSARGGAWSPNGTIVFAPSTKTPLFKIAASGGTPSPITTVDQRIYSHRWPQFLPDGEHFLFVGQSSDASLQGLYAGSLDSKEIKRILPVPLSFAFAAPHHLFYVRDHLLVRQELDPKRLELSGEPAIISDAMTYFGDRAYVPVAAASDGTVAFRRNGIVKMRLAWYDRDGRRTASIGEPGEYEGLSLSPDGTKLVFGQFDASEGLNHLAICGANEGVPRRFSFNRGNQYSPIWSRDGSRIAFSDDYSGVDTISVKPASGAGEEKPLTPPPASSQYVQSWSPDGTVILYSHSDPSTGLDVYALPVAGGAAKPFLNGRSDESQAKFSPDGKWIVYTSTESGRPEVYVQPFPATGAKWQVSTEGGEQPRWRRDGGEIFYLAPDRNLMAVLVRVPGAFDAESPRRLFDTNIPFGDLGVSQAYDVANDGQRFVIASVDPLLPPSGITVVTGSQ